MLSKARKRRIWLLLEKHNRIIVSKALGRYRQNKDKSGTKDLINSGGFSNAAHKSVDKVERAIENTAAAPTEDLQSQ